MASRRRPRSDCSSAPTSSPRRKTLVHGTHLFGVDRRHGLPAARTHSLMPIDSTRARRLRTLSFGFNPGLRTGSERTSCPSRRQVITSPGDRSCSGWMDQAVCVWHQWGASTVPFMRPRARRAGGDAGCRATGRSCRSTRAIREPEAPPRRNAGSVARCPGRWSSRTGAAPTSTRSRPRRARTGGGTPRRPSAAP